MTRNAQWDLGQEAARDIAASLNVLLADSFVLLQKTKGCRWHVSGPYVQSYQLLFRAFEEQINATIDDIAERIRRIGSTALSSMGELCRLRRLFDNDHSLSAPGMLAQLQDDNLQLAGYLRETYFLCDGYGDVATTNHLEKWIDDAEGRARYLFAAAQPIRGADKETT